MEWTPANCPPESTDSNTALWLADSMGAIAQGGYRSELHPPAGQFLNPDGAPLTDIAWWKPRTPNQLAPAPLYL